MQWLNRAMLRLPTENTLDREEKTMAEWVERKISDIGTVVGGATPSTKKPENYEDGKIAWITPKDLSTFSGRYIERGERNITEIGLKSCSTQLLPPNTILFSSRAPIGYVAIAANEVCTNQGFKSVIPNENTDPLFLFYLLKYNKDKIEGMGSGTTFKEVSGNTMKNIVVNVPTDKKVQEKIAAILGSIDDKIEENEQINNNLEQQAQALFKSWFVEFEPFNGTMPSDWEIVPLEKIADFQNGYAFKSKELLNEPSPDCYQVFKQGHIARGGGFIPDGTKSWYPKSIASKLEKFVLKKGDILMAMTDMKDNVAILGNTAVMPLDNEYIVNQRVGHLRANGYKGVTYPFIYLLTNSTDFLVDLRSRANSGVQVNLSSSEIKASQTVLPSEEVNNAFSEITLPMFEIIINNQLENQRLAQLRDTLLPKLMSGELDVSDIEL